MMKRNTLLLLLVVMATFNSKAHVSLIYPVGGENFYPGDTVTIVWQELVHHNTLDWDLYFSRDGGSTWESIQTDILYDSLRYRWIVPEVLTTQGKIKIVQDNSDVDYEDTSDNFTIKSKISSGARFEQIEVNVYPSPASDVLHIDIGPDNDRELFIFDAAGKQIINMTVSGETAIRLNGLQEGLYILIIQIKGHPLVSKFQIIR